MPRSSAAMLPAAAQSTARRPSAPTTSASPSRRRSVAYDNFQLREAAAAAARWLELNPTNEQARRLRRRRGAAAAPARHRGRALRRAARHCIHQSRQPVSSRSARHCRRGDAAGRHGAVPAARRAAPEGRGRPVRARQGRAAFRELRARARALRRRATELAPYWVPAQMLLARARSPPGRKSEGLAIAREVVTGAETDTRDAPRVRDAARGYRARRGSARDADAVRDGHRRWCRVRVRALGRARPAAGRPRRSQRALRGTCSPPGAQIVRSALLPGRRSPSDARTRSVRCAITRASPAATTRSRRSARRTHQGRASPASEAGLAAPRGIRPRASASGPRSS